VEHWSIGTLEHWNMRRREPEPVSVTASLREIVETILRDRAVPGLVLAIARENIAGKGVAPEGTTRVVAEVERLAVGTDAAGTQLTPEALLPVASITKLATSLAVLRLHATGVLSVEDPLAAHLPGAAAAVPGVTLRRLLSHTSGLPLDLAPGTAPYAPGLDWPALARACRSTPLLDPPMTRVQYSNLGAGLLAQIVEKLTERPFASALEHLVLGPLGIEGYLASEPPRPVARLSGNLGKHAGTEIEAYNSPFWRSLGLPWGGLVTTVDGALALVRAFAGVPAGFLPDALRTEAIRDTTNGLPGGISDSLSWPHCAWGLGPELRGDKTPHHSASTASPGSFGHVGASGSLAWADPEAGVSWAILGTRTFESWWKDLPTLGDAILRGGTP
jgi:beta-lactamase class C